MLLLSFISRLMWLRSVLGRVRVLTLRLCRLVRLLKFSLVVMVVMEGKDKQTMKGQTSTKRTHS